MKTAVAGLVLLLASCASSHKKVEWRDFGADPAMNPDYLNAAMAAAMPGEPHAEFAKGVGTYDVTGKMWSAPGGPAATMNAEATVEVILDGRYLLEHFSSTFQGMPFKGVLLMGYDNVAQQYWNLWIDSMSTGYSLATGEEDAEGAIAMAGTMRDVMTPKGRPYRSVTRHDADGSFTVSMYDSLPDGSEFQVMELNYRKKSN